MLGAKTCGMQGASPTLYEGQERALAPIGPGSAGHFGRRHDAGQVHSSNSPQFWQFPASTGQQQQLAGSLEGTLHTRSQESGMRERGVQQMIRGCVVLQQNLCYAASHIAMPSTLLTHMETHTAQRSNSHLVCMLRR